MHPTNNAGLTGGNDAAAAADDAGSGKAEVARLPDKDNPFAWKRATEAGRRGARELLRQLTDEEIARYIEVAKDQIAIEERYATLKVACALAGAGLTAYSLRLGILSGFGKWVIAGLGLGLAMGYWPWRVFQCRQLWQAHLDAARNEQRQRNLAV